VRSRSPAPKPSRAPSDPPAAAGLEGSVGPSGEANGGEGEVASGGEALGPDPVPPGSRWLARLSVAALVFFLLQILSYGYGRDQGIYAMVARAILEGGMPYRDAFDFKPPGIFVVFTLSRALFGPAQWGVRLLEVAGLVGMAVAMVRLADRLWGQRGVGLLAAAFAVTVHAQLDFWHTAQPESFGGMLTIFGLLAATPPASSAPGGPRPSRLLLAGILFGMAGLLKPPLAGGGAVLALSLAGRAGAQKGAAPPTRPSGGATPESFIRAVLRPIGWIALGGVLPIAACALWFSARGALGDLHRVLFVFTPHYTALGWQDASVLAQSWYGLSEWLTRYSGPLALGLGCLLALHPSRRERFGVALLAGVVAIHLAGVIMQAKFFPYHYGATWPVTALLAALGLWKAWAWCARRGRLATGLLVAAFVVVAFARSATKDVAESYLERTARRVALFAAGGRDQEGLDRLASVADVNAVANRAVAAYLREQVAPGRPVFVWGFEPVIYDLADRPSATRYLYNVPQRVAWSRDEARADLMRDLAARPPAAIVVERYDVFPMVTGDVIDSRDALNGFPALADLIHDRYALATSIEDFDVYLAR